MLVFLVLLANSWLSAKMDNNQPDYDQFFTEVTDDEEAEDREAMCDDCSVIVENMAELRKHKRMHHDRLTCNHCGQVANGYKKLMDHVRLHKKASCPNCHKEVTKKRLNEHLKYCLNGQQSRKKNLTCGTCGYKASSTKKLGSHLKTHEVKIIKMHTCEYCDYKSKKAANVRRHQDKCRAKLRLQPPANGPVSKEELVDLFSDMHTSMTDFKQMLQFFVEKFGSEWFEQGSMKCVQVHRMS